MDFAPSHILANRRIRGISLLGMESVARNQSVDALCLYACLALCSVLLSIYLFRRSRKDCLLVTAAGLIFFALTWIADFLVQAGLISSIFSSESHRTLFYSQPIDWCYTVLPCTVTIWGILWLALRRTIPGRVVDEILFRIERKS